VFARNHNFEATQHILNTTGVVASSFAEELLGAGSEINSTKAGARAVWENASRLSSLTGSWLLGVPCEADNPSGMATIANDEDLFRYAARARGRVVLITGQGARVREPTTDTSPLFVLISLYL